MRGPSPLLLLALCGCLINPGLRDQRLDQVACENNPAPSAYRDEDGDGWGDAATQTKACATSGPGWVDRAGDCDDGASDVHPDADERCNDRDDDCDEAVDEQAVDAVTWYPDGDGDGFGYELGGVSTCDGAPGADWIDRGGDCDDSEAGVNPDALEVCNGLDENCDGVPDQPAPYGSPVFFPDDDQDGFGDGTQPTPACEQPDGYLTDSNDCDDTEPLTYPGATDDPLIDRDCDGVAGGMRVADADIYGGTGQFLGHAVAGVGDVDADGIPDFLAGAPGSDPLLDPGTAWLVIGGPVSGDRLISTIGLGFDGEAVDDAAASAVSGGGDHNGDGVADFAVGSPGHQSGRGSIYVVFGGPGITAAGLAYATEYRGDLAGDACGSALSLEGDLTGDAYADAVAGAPLERTGGDEAGAVYVVAGAPDVGPSLALTGEIRMTGASGERAGTSVGRIADFDGDGVGDLAVGGTGVHDGVPETGGVWLLDGGPLTPGSLNNVADHLFLGEADGDLAGASVAGAGDVDGDGRDDLIVGAPGHDGLAGAAYVVLGSPGGGPVQALGTASALIFRGGVGELAGWSVRGAGDVDADGFDDLLIGAPAAGGDGRGAVYLQLGAATLPTTVDPTTVSVALLGELPTDATGSSVAGIGDIDGDGYDDLLLGGAGHDHGNPDTGGVYLIHGMPL